MNRTITFHNRTGIFDNPSFFLTDTEPLILKFKGLSNRIGKYAVTVVCGKNKKTIYMPSSHTVEISADFLKKCVNVSTLEIYLELRNSAGTEKLIRSAIDENDKEGFFIEPLVLETAKTGLNVISLVEKLLSVEKRLAIAEEKLAEFDDSGIPLICE